MRIVSWNVDHKAGRTGRSNPISPNVALGIATFAADVVVLTEYVPGVSHESFCTQLRSLGLASFHLSSLSPGHNHVLIATRLPSSPGELTLGNPAPNADCTLLHVHLESQGVEIVGMRVPAYKRRPQK